MPLARVIEISENSTKHNETVTCLRSRYRWLSIFKRTYDWNGWYAGSGYKRLIETERKHRTDNQPLKRWATSDMWIFILSRGDNHVPTTISDWCSLSRTIEAVAANAMGDARPWRLDVLLQDLILALHIRIEFRSRVHTKLASYGVGQTISMCDWNAWRANIF